MALDVLSALFALIAALIVLQTGGVRTASMLILFLLPVQEVARPLRVFTSVLACALVGAEILRRLNQKEKIETYFPILGLPLIAVLSLLVHPTIDHPYARLKSSGILFNYIGAVAAFQLIWWSVRDPADAVGMLRKFTVFVVVASAAGVLVSVAGYTETIADFQAEIQAEAGLPRFAERSFLFFRHPNQNAYFAAFGIFFLIARAISNRRVFPTTPEITNQENGLASPRQWKRRLQQRRRVWFFLAAVLVIGANFILSGSRGAILAVPVALLGGFYLARRTRLAITSTFAILTALPFVFVLLVGIGTGEAAVTDGEELASRLSDITKPGSALRTRPILWKGAWDAFLEQPILGVGPTNLPYYFLYQTPDMMTWSEEFLSTAPAHSLYLHLLATTGILGLVTLGWLGLSILRRTLRQTRSSADPAVQELGFAGLFTLLFLLVVGGLGHTVFGIYYFNTSIFFVIFALTLAGSRAHSGKTLHGLA